ncbi:MAG: CapA family protein [bacterium]
MIKFCLFSFYLGMVAVLPGQEIQKDSLNARIVQLSPEIFSEPRSGITIVAVGDLNFARSEAPVDSSGGVSNRGVFPFSHYSANIADLIDGDINYCNLETTVIAHNRLSAADKSYCFRIHPNGVKHLCDIGFNLFSLANNHMEDYGKQGVVETVQNMKEISRYYNLAYSGAGENLEQATRPSILEVRGYRIAFSSIGFSGLPAYQSSPGVATPNYFETICERLAAEDADYRILAMHRGQERDPYVQGYQMEIARRAMDEYGIDLVIGNHPHIAQAVEYREGKMAFYSLGNFLMLGARDMATVPGGTNRMDFGVLAKIYLSNQLTLDSVAVIPIYDMHYQPHPVEDSSGVRQRIDWLNTISTSPYISGIESPVVFSSDGKQGLFVPPGD